MFPILIHERRAGPKKRVLLAACAILASVVAPSASIGKTECPGRNVWTSVGSDEFRLPLGLLRSQGVTTDGDGWIFSWQGGLERTDDAYRTRRANTLPPDIALEPEISADANHIGGNHIGDIDTHEGKIFAPVEDGAISLGVASVNQPEYQRPYIAIYDAKTLLYTGVRHPLPLDLHLAGVPWVAVNGKAREVYTAEWDMPHDRINVFDLDLEFVRFIPLRYPDSFGPGFHLSRIQGAKVFRGALYATRDDDEKSVYTIDLETGDVEKLFSLRPDGPSEIEGLAFRETNGRGQMHVLLVRDNRIDASGGFANIRVLFHHFALSCAAR